MQLHILAGMIDELEKIGARMRTAGFMQSRRGTRPYRVDTLLGKDQASPGYVEPNTSAQTPESEQPAEPSLAQNEGDGGDPSIGKTAEILEPGSRTEKALKGFASARPYVAEGVKAGVPAAVLGNIVGGRRLGTIAGVGGAGLGVANEALKRWAQKNKGQAVAKKLLEGQGK
jgi:hypothetical protein